MFLGSSINPEYFEEKVNLFVALGPVSNMWNVRSNSASAWPEMQYLAQKLHAYNLLDAGWLEE